MRKSRFTDEGLTRPQWGRVSPDEQIIGMIKEQEAGMAMAEVCRRHGLSPATFYKLKGKYGGMDVSDARKLKALEDENARLKKLLAEQMLDTAALRELLSKKW